MKKVVRESLNEKKDENLTLDDLAYEFIRDVLKMGSRDNLFDKFLNKKKVDSNLLKPLINKVVKRISEKW